MTNRKVYKVDFALFPMEIRKKDELLKMSKKELVEVIWKYQEELAVKEECREILRRGSGVNFHRC